MSTERSRRPSLSRARGPDAERPEASRSVTASKTAARRALRSRTARATPFRLLLLSLVLACGGDSAPVEPPPTPAVPSPVATSITISPGSATLNALGEAAQLRAQVLDQNGQAMAGATVSWSSSNDSVAAVTDGGLVTAIANGSASVTAAAASLTANAAITVAQQVAQVQLSPAADTLLALEDTLRLSATAVDLNQHRVPGVTFTWESSDTTIVSVDSTGVVRAAGVGSTTITAAADSVSGTAHVTIPGPAPFDPTPPPSDPTPVSPDAEACDGWEDWFVGEYRYSNNVWNRQDTTDYEQCIMRRTLPGGEVEYGWRWRWPEREGRVKAYPEVVYGRKPWSRRSTTSELPKQIGAVERLEVDYEAYLTAEGRYNLSFDFWITRDNPPSESGVSHEVMIWLDHDSGPAPPQYYVGPVRLDGALWDLYVWPDRVWRDSEGKTRYVADFIAFLRHEDQYVGSVDLLTFFQYLVDKGYVPAHHYLTAIELGNEARSGTGELWLKKFEVHQR
ncbi:MAG: hypothetical protein F4164_10755 [Gemmatimonadales bacterium]|nr:hypothetical protein [Gemmatimonadales bacterium]MYG49820.1 hypothetical protein [Gemmatimonadales bacterium]MYK00679.1 hypothetical protein [Candidatus Palauibacter ramosifaciens]